MNVSISLEVMIFIEGIHDVDWPCRPTWKNRVVRLTRTPVNSLHVHTKNGARADTTSTLVKRLLITVG